MTNVSNVYLGLSRAWVGAGLGRPGPLPPGTSLGRWCSAPNGPAGWVPRWTPGWPPPGTGGTAAGPVPAGGAPVGGAAPSGAGLPGDDGCGGTPEPSPRAGPWPGIWPAAGWPPIPPGWP